MCIKSRILQLLFLIIVINTHLISQISFYVDEDIFYPDLRIRIGNDVSLPDVRILIDENIMFSDFSVGITDKKYQADFIIVNSKFGADKTVRAGDDVSLPDIRIKVGNDISLPDVRIIIKKSGTVDYLVYTEKSFLQLNDLIIALLPAINKKLNYSLKNIPSLNPNGGIGVPETFAIIAHSMSTVSEAGRVLSKIGESANTLASKNLILVVCRSGLSYPMNSSYDSISELDSDADSQLNISGDFYHVYLFKMDNKGRCTEQQHIHYKAYD